MASKLVLLARAGLRAAAPARRHVSLRAFAPAPRTLTALRGVRAFSAAEEEPWVAVKDSASGGTYYHNPLTDAVTMVGAAKPDWEPVVDAASDGVYWWHPATDATTPVGAACPALVQH
ncbi:hypothetical protein M885DRAFT_564202 [Pelagophyceae sp. CCMP2097]|nr:hypothetical protein M885DRAFT_564202 [Pelagophyceae sp. CCMP2097]